MNDHNSKSVRRGKIPGEVFCVSLLNGEGKFLSQQNWSQVVIAIFVCVQLTLVEIGLGCGASS